MRRKQQDVGKQLRAYYQLVKSELVNLAEEAVVIAHRASQQSGAGRRWAALGGRVGVGRKREVPKYTGAVVESGASQALIHQMSIQVTYH